MTHQARKRFAQNFLIDTSVINQIINSIDLSPGQHWLEIGPGQGALTAPLLDSGVDLDVIELDRNLISLLKEKFSHSDNLRIHSGDVLHFDFAKLTNSGERIHIIGNLPYNISSPLLFHLLDSALGIEDMLFMLQKEVVDRICAKPGSKKYGRLSVMIQYHCATEKLFNVPAESFRPVPKVISAMVRLVPYLKPPITVYDHTDFSFVVTQAFSQRRKTLRNALKKIFTESEIAHLAIDPNKRAETLTLESFARLANFYTQKREEIIKDV